MMLYTVQSGDSVYDIARRYGVDSLRLLVDNQIELPGELIPGQVLLVPASYQTYRVSPGQSLYRIAASYGTTVERLLQLNPHITDPAAITAYSDIRIPVQAADKRGVDANGYAYPDIDRAVLEQTFRYLTYISIFSYEANADGTLRPANDEPLIAAARENGVAPMMVLTNLAAAGGFSSDIASAILQDSAVQESLLNEVQAVLEQKAYYGLDVDFEYVYENERALYNAFLERVAARFSPLGYRLTSAVAPKLSGAQQGRLYTAHDYAAHGRLMDAVIIMTYEWGYLYGPPMAVAPIGPVEQVIRYAVSEIPPEKILMGMPNYGYDWTLPYREGVPARSISNAQALQTARRYGADIRYDEQAQAPYFHYYDEQGREHVVWFHDARSELARLRLVEQYGLAGISYWTIGNFYLPGYLALTSLYTINKAALSEPL